MKHTRIQVSPFSSETAVPKEDCVSVAKISPLFSVGCVPTHATVLAISVKCPSSVTSEHYSRGSTLNLSCGMDSLWTAL